MLMCPCHTLLKASPLMAPAVPERQPCPRWLPLPLTPFHIFYDPAALPRPKQAFVFFTLCLLPAQPFLPNAFSDYWAVGVSSRPQAERNLLYQRPSCVTNPQCHQHSRGDWGGSWGGDLQPPPRHPGPQGDPPSHSGIEVKEDEITAQGQTLPLNTF